MVLAATEQLTGYMPVQQEDLCFKSICLTPNDIGALEEVQIAYFLEKYDTPNGIMAILRQLAQKAAKINLVGK